MNAALRWRDQFRGEASNVPIPKPVRRHQEIAVNNQLFAGAQATMQFRCCHFETRRWIHEQSEAWHSIRRADHAALSPLRNMLVTSVCKGLVWRLEWAR